MNKKIYCLRIVLLCHCLISVAQTKFDKLIWFNNLPSFVAKENGHIFVNSIEYKKNYYVFGFNTGRIQTMNCNDIYDGWNVFKLDSNGNLLKAVRIGGPIDGERMFFPAIQTKNKGFLIPGHSYSFSYTQRCDSFDSDCNFLKLDSNLNFQWLKSIGGKRGEIALGVLELKSGRYMAFGETQSFGHPATLPWDSANTDIYIMKLDNSGNLVHSITYGTKDFDEILAIEKDENDFIYLAGHYGGPTSPNGLSSPFLIKLDTNLNIVWANYFSVPPDRDTSVFLSIKFFNNRLYCVSHHISLKLSISHYYGNIAVINPTTGDIERSTIKSYPFLLLGTADLDTKIFLYNNKIYNQWWTWYSPAPYAIRTFVSFDTTLNLLSSIYSPKPFKETCISGTPGAGSNINYISMASEQNFILGSTAILDTLNFTKNYLYLSKMATDFETCYPDTGSIEEDALTISYIPIATGSITSVNQGIVLSWTPTIVEGAKDSSLCFCPDIPVQTQITPVNCFSNGSATLTPLQNDNYTYQWSPPVSSTNTASNLSAGQYTVIISDSTGCWHKNIITIPAQLSFPLSVSGNTLLCSTQSTTLSASGAQSYTWSTGSTDSSIVLQTSVTTNYTLIAAAGNCTQTTVWTVSVNPTPTLLVSPLSGTISSGDTLAISVSGANSYSVLSLPNYYWNNNTLYAFPREKQFFCIVGEQNTCRDTVCVKITIDGSCVELEIPNIFTPNQDNVNEHWKVNWKCPELIEDFNVQIFDRWGVLVYQSADKFFKWDGHCSEKLTLPDFNECPTGTYYYVLEWTSYSKKHQKKGYITLLR